MKCKRNIDNMVLMIATFSLTKILTFCQLDVL